METDHSTSLFSHWNVTNFGAYSDNDCIFTSCEMNLELCKNKKQFHLLLSPYLNDGVVFLLLSIIRYYIIVNYKILLIYKISSIGWLY